MERKQLIVAGLVYCVISVLINWGLFVTFPQMVAYAASKDDISNIEHQLNRIEEKVDNLLLR